ncbi:hypothetical protein VC290_02420 [Xanthomonas campestris]|uniref:hypothetical protein n=1 Tax=Xanthomonas campestris TaxID=339 RepID=UPI001CD55744|nr:hypothetical protein [Xanthomonas campestris]MEA9479271.1 hypothetical protein [Xanthomonas campestris]
MTWRTPSSLKWLIVKHSRLQGEVELLRREAEELDSQVVAQRQRLERAEKNLLAIETSLGMHEVQVDVGDIAAVIPHVNQPIYRHGDLTRNLYAALRIAGDWLTTGELVERLTGHTYENCDRKLYERIRRSFRKRLTSLVSKGSVEREFSQGTTDFRQNHTRWRLLSGRH